MLIPTAFGRLRFAGEACFLEHRNTSNHPVRTRLVRAREDGTVGTAGEAAAFLAGEVGLEEESLVFLDGFLVGEQANLELAVRGATSPPSHEGTLIYSGARSNLVKPVGTRLLRRLGDPVLATDMLKNCGKSHGEQIVVRGAEAVSLSGVPSIEIDSVEGC